MELLVYSERQLSLPIIAMGKKLIARGKSEIQGGMLALSLFAIVTLAFCGGCKPFTGGGEDAEDNPLVDQVSDHMPEFARIRGRCAVSDPVRS